MKLGFFLTVLALALIYALVGIFGYYVSYRTDSRVCPWAYSLDENKPLLVGKWSGKFIEPDSVEKRISLEIFEPYTKNERIFYSIGLPYKRRLCLKSNKFAGILKIESKDRKEEYKINGNINIKNIQLFDFHFLANENEKAPYHYSFLFTDGFWKENDMNFLTTIVFRRSNYRNSLKNYDPNSNKKVKVFLSRVMPK